MHAKAWRAKEWRRRRSSGVGRRGSRRRKPGSGRLHAGLSQARTAGSPRGAGSKRRWIGCYASGPPQRVSASAAPLPARRVRIGSTGRLGPPSGSLGRPDRAYLPESAAWSRRRSGRSAPSGRGSGFPESLQRSGSGRTRGAVARAGAPPCGAVIVASGRRECASPCAPSSAAGFGPCGRGVECGSTPVSVPTVRDGILRDTARSSKARRVGGRSVGPSGGWPGRRLPAGGTVVGQRRTFVRKGAALRRSGRGDSPRCEPVWRDGHSFGGAVGQTKKPPATP